MGWDGITNAASGLALYSICTKG
ncbi:hypothetical protein GKC39_16415 [Bacillus velezensis]|uniref:Uncharacterized protein n=1 Tax=Bacillus velezensis TaxID=492670 RepID=A0A6A8LID3_BACVE|nr:hypothetical protein [Bacillus velezensis]MSE03638.1 hypothetical protein [Bacillus velezensis]MSE13118.1 hypothetical protein [Bacillus velezensis]